MTQSAVKESECCRRMVPGSSGLQHQINAETEDSAKIEEGGWKR